MALPALVPFFLTGAAESALVLGAKRAASKFAIGAEVAGMVADAVGIFNSVRVWAADKPAAFDLTEDQKDLYGRALTIGDNTYAVDDHFTSKITDLYRELLANERKEGDDDIAELMQLISGKKHVAMSEVDDVVRDAPLRATMSLIENPKLVEPDVVVDYLSAHLHPIDGADPVEIYRHNMKETPYRDLVRDITVGLLPRANSRDILNNISVLEAKSYDAVIESVERHAGMTFDSIIAMADALSDERLVNYARARNSL